MQAFGKIIYISFKYRKPPVPGPVKTALVQEVLIAIQMKFLKMPKITNPIAQAMGTEG